MRDPIEYPYGHPSHTHHHHHRRDSEGREDSRNEVYGYGNPPPPSDHYPPHATPGFAAPPPPATHTHTAHYGSSEPYPPPGQRLSYDYPPSQSHPPPHHHQESQTYPPVTQQRPPSVVHHVSHEVDATGPEFSNKPTVKVFCKANPNFSLTIRGETVMLARSDPNDPYQHWYKDLKYSTRIKDEAGFPSFALVNKATGLALKHSVGPAEPVQFVAYSSEKPDLSILWTESQDFGEGYRAVRMVNNIHLNMDAFHGDEASGGVRDGTTIVLWQWNHGPNQLWKITPY